MTKGFVVTAAAWLEILVGVAFVVMPELPCRLLFAVTPEGIAGPLGRFAGIALISLGIACLRSAQDRGLNGVLGLLVFNFGATVFCAWVALATTFRGFLLWPVVILHAVIAAALVPQFLARDSHAS